MTLLAIASVWTVLIVLIAGFVARATRPYSPVPGDPAWLGTLMTGESFVEHELPVERDRLAIPVG